MDNNLHFAYIASLLIETYYIKLRELSYQNQEDSPEYEEIINILKKAIQGENEIYNELTIVEINNAINYYNQNKPKNVTEVRMRGQLRQTLRKSHNTEFNINLGNIITSKIIIDVLKRTLFKILKLKELNAPEEDIEALLLYNDIYKYNYLTGNEYIEKLALEYKFDILSLPNIKFDDIESKFETQFIKNSTNIAFEYIKDSIYELVNFKSNDKYLSIYINLFEVSRVEVMLPYLTKDSLVRLSNYLNHLHPNENNDALNKIKRLVAKRKEELH